MAPLARHEVRRVAEYFEGDLKQAYSFTQNIWLPDAIRSMDVLDGAIRSFDVERALFMCDHLREGARSVGAGTLVRRLTHVETLLQQRRWIVALQLTNTLETQLFGIARWLKRRLRRFETAPVRLSAG